MQHVSKMKLLNEFFYASYYNALQTETAKKKKKKGLMRTSISLGLHRSNRNKLFRKLGENRRRIEIRLRRKHPIPRSANSFIRTKKNIYSFVRAKKHKIAIGKKFNRNS